MESYEEWKEKIKRESKHWRGRAPFEIDDYERMYGKEVHNDIFLAVYDAVSKSKDWESIREKIGAYFDIYQRCNKGSELMQTPRVKKKFCKAFSLQNKENWI